MSTSCASSLALHSLNPKTSLSLPDQHKPTFLSFPYFKKPISLPASLIRFVEPPASSLLRNVAVSYEFGQEEGLASSEEEESSFSPDLKLFVGNLPFSVDSAQLAELFENVGNVQMVEVIYDKVTGRSRGFGFVTMSSVEDVKAAAQQFNGYELEGRALRVNSGPPRPRESSRVPRGGFGGSGGRGSESFDSANRLYVGNLSWGVDNLALETLFSEQGKVMEARVVYDRESGRSRGFGFVTYSTPEEVDSAIETLNGVELDGRAIRVSIAEARPRH